MHSSLAAAASVAVCLLVDAVCATPLVDIGNTSQPSSNLTAMEIKFLQAFASKFDLETAMKIFDAAQARSVNNAIALHPSTCAC